MCVHVSTVCVCVRVCVKERYYLTPFKTGAQVDKQVRPGMKPRGYLHLICIALPSTLCRTVSCRSKPSSQRHSLMTTHTSFLSRFLTHTHTHTHIHSLSHKHMKAQVGWHVIQSNRILPCVCWCVSLPTHVYLNSQMTKPLW